MTTNELMELKVDNTAKDVYKAFYTSKTEVTALVVRAYQKAQRESTSLSAIIDNIWKDDKTSLATRVFALFFFGQRDGIKEGASDPNNAIIHTLLFAKVLTMSPEYLEKEGKAIEESLE